uniref:Uncharacterized protein n=1 Tax=Timema douglasi TaxID=61478 RepID=A0A7R8Z850_TIMDO|nr:unnamed protein product [Timema douglasi]
MEGWFGSTFTMANGSESGKMEFINVERLTTELSDSVFGKNDPATSVDLNKTKVLFENSLLAGGDGLATTKPNVSTDFILNESAISPAASNGAKRKRDESPEHYNLVMDEDVKARSRLQDSLRRCCTLCTPTRQPSKQCSATLIPHRLEVTSQS